MHVQGQGVKEGGEWSLDAFNQARLKMANQQLDGLGVVIYSLVAGIGFEPMTFGL